MILKGKVSSVMFRIGVRDAGDASHAAKIVIIALKMMLVTTLVAGIVLVDGDDRFADLFRNMKW